MKDSLLRVSITTEEHAIPQAHTVLGWCVPDIEEAVNELKAKVSALSGMLFTAG